MGTNERFNGVQFCHDLLSHLPHYNRPTHFVTRIDGPLPYLCKDISAYNVRKDGTQDMVFDWDGGLQEVNGATALKQRLLTALGWKVAHIPFWAWARSNSEEARRNVCLKALQDIGVDLDDLVV